ncbi:hypothetical protein PROVRUST_05300 [Providencia rustigianii DSM 4541]|uniref:Uncharacterized protein n=1 Tax=Providencia rustigianii DSM 4541 TaxID=500637 RepID=D1NZE6_9GAMM|nr:hypothetical protein PROVRUST_05300 [Providencia rustigianii DSM 4541]
MIELIDRIENNQCGHVQAEIYTFCLFFQIFLYCGAFLSHSV